jgi:hypothetical protein
MPRTLKIFVALLAVCTLLAFFVPQLVLVVFLTPHLFHALGVPGLLEHGGHCGWGWCSPSALGWVLMAVVWLAIAWLAAWGLAWLGRKPRA